MKKGASEPATNLQKACRNFTISLTEMPMGIGSYGGQNWMTERALFHWEIRLEK